MATVVHTTGLNPVSNVAASFRAWGLAISTNLATVGFVQTADSGQINWATVSPAGASTAAGYEIWRFNDALQATAPIFFKLEYGQNASTSGPGLWITAGTGSNGSGTITGTAITGITNAVSSRQPILSVGASASTPLCDAWVNGCDGSGIGILLFLNGQTTNCGLGLVIERTRNWDGTANGEGVVITSLVQAGSGLLAICYLPGIGLNGQGIRPAQPTVAVTTGIIGGVLYPTPMFTTVAQRPWAPSQLIMTICAGDIASNATFSMNHYGVSQTWIAAGVTSTLLAWGSQLGGGNQQSFIFRTS